MGHVLAFRARPNARKITTELEQAEWAFVSGVRLWVGALLRCEEPFADLRAVMQAEGAADAALSIDALMRIIARAGRRAIDIRAAHRLALSDDEARLLHAAACAQRGGVAIAADLLSADLLSAEGTDLALLPLVGLGKIFAAAGLYFEPRDDFAPTLRFP